MTKAIIIGAGPSLQENLDFYKKLGKFHGQIFCTDGAINKFLENGFMPDFVTTLEDTPDLDKYYNTDIVKKHGSKIIALISDRVHQNTRLSMVNAKMKVEVAAKCRNYMTSNVGLFSYIAATAEFNNDEIYLIGMDHCYPRGEGPPVDRNSELFKYGFNVMINKYNNEEIILHPAFMLWQEEFTFYANKFPKVKIYNLTGRGALFSDKFIWSPIKTLKSWNEV